MVPKEVSPKINMSKSYEVVAMSVIERALDIPMSRTQRTYFWESLHVVLLCQLFLPLNPHFPRLFRDPTIAAHNHRMQLKQARDIDSIEGQQEQQCFKIKEDGRGNNEMMSAFSPGSSSSLRLRRRI